MNSATEVYLGHQNKRQIIKIHKVLWRWDDLIHTKGQGYLQNSLLRASLLQYFLIKFNHWAANTKFLCKFQVLVIYSRLSCYKRIPVIRECNCIDNVCIFLHILLCMLLWSFAVLIFQSSSCYTDTSRVLQEPHVQFKSMPKINLQLMKKTC